MKKIYTYFLFFATVCSAIFYLLFIVSEFETPTERLEFKVRITKATVHLFQQLLIKYFQDNGIYPTTNQGLQALVDRPTTAPIPKHYPKGGYFEEPVDFIDPWGNLYHYIYQLVNGEHEITIISLAADGKLGGKREQTDIVSVCKQRPAEPLKCTFTSLPRSAW